MSENSICVNLKPEKKLFIVQYKLTNTISLYIAQNFGYNNPDFWHTILPFANAFVRMVCSWLFYLSLI